MDLIAHVRKKPNSDEWDEPHLLKEHLEGTRRLVEEWTADFGAEKLGMILGLIHDAGKASEEFQKKIRILSGFEADRYADKSVPAAAHSDSGAQYLLSRYSKLGKILAYCVAGHHGGLPDGLSDEDSCLTARLRRVLDEFQTGYASLQIDLPDTILPEDIISHSYSKVDGFSISFLIRMLFSCLVDADFLDTEAYMSPDKSDLRKQPKNFEGLLSRLNAYIEHISQGKSNKNIARERANILFECLKSAEQSPGFFSLTVPTGGGKTLSSMAFALAHAAKFNKSRIIYAIPFTSIIEQNAEVFRQALGEDIVLEHHSNIDLDDRNYQKKLASENWDAPVIVTTNVQLFESLFAYKPSKCRKLHNVVNSVIVIDEAQMLSPDYLRPTLRVMQELVFRFGCTVVLCTATQPALNRTEDFDYGLENVREIISDPNALYDKFRRVHVTDLDETLSIEQLSQRLKANKQVLCIVNTRREAMELYQSIGSVEGHFHLSTFMCADHRTTIFKRIRERLSSGALCRVVSTQLIEAGVDVDFPVVFRAEAGIDSIAQAAGRCNREGKLAEGGRVFVVHFENRPPSGILRQSADEGNKAIQLHQEDILSLNAVNDYFKSFYWKRDGANELDRHKIIQLLNEDVNPNLNFPFRKVFSNYCLIESNTLSVIIPWREGKKICDQLKTSKYPDRYLLRKLQRYIVQVRKEVFNELWTAGVLNDLFGDKSTFLLTNEKLYDSNIGLNTKQSLNYDTAALIV